MRRSATKCGRNWGDRRPLQRPVLMRNTIAGVLIAVAGVGGLWGVGFFLRTSWAPVLRPGLADLSEAARNAELARFRSQTFLIQQIGAFLGIYAYAALSERIGRRPAMFLFFALAFGVVEGTFWGVRDMTTAYIWGFALGFCRSSPRSQLCCVFPGAVSYSPPGHRRGFCYNTARLLAAGAPFLLGSLHRISPTLPTSPQGCASQPASWPASMFWDSSERAIGRRPRENRFRSRTTAHCGLCVWKEAQGKAGLSRCRREGRTFGRSVIYARLRGQAEPCVAGLPERLELDVLVPAVGAVLLQAM